MMMQSRGRRPDLESRQGLDDAGMLDMEELHERASCTQALRRKLTRTPSESSESSWNSPSSSLSSRDLKKSKRKKLKKRRSSGASSTSSYGSSAERSSSRSSSSSSNSTPGKSRGVMMLRRLARQRNERLREHGDELDNERNAKVHRLQRLRRMGSSSSSVASSASPSPSRFVKEMTNIGSSSPRTPHRESLKRRPSSGSYSSSGQRRSRAARKPLDEKRVSLRGLTKADGHITRDEARRLCEEELDADLETAFSRASNSRTSTRIAPLATLSEVRDDEADDYESGNASVRGLIRLARHGDTKSLVAMVDKAGGSIDIDGKSSSGKTALISAAEHGHVGTVIALFGRGANLEETDLHGNTALLRAASKGHLEVLVMLLSAGASDVARNDKGESAVVLAAAKLADAKRQTFDQRMQILLTLFERAKPDLETGRIPQYVASDSGVIEHRRTRELLEEWSAARALEKDLHLPSQSEFHKCNLGEFFKTRHASYDMHIWFKVLLLLCFVVYDTYLKHFESSYKTYIVYAVLYFGAYSI